jgi:hypothetical protein
MSIMVGSNFINPKPGNKQLTDSLLPNPLQELQGSYVK